MTVEQQPNEEAEAPAAPEPADTPEIPPDEDVRVGPEQSDEPQAGSTEPAD
jgi:hypothetical protein